MNGLEGGQASNLWTRCVGCCHIELAGETVRVGTLYREASRNRESVSFEYHRDWFKNEQRFALEPALQVGAGRFYPDQGREMFAAISDSAPDTWGRQLMQRMERLGLYRQYH